MKTTYKAVSRFQGHEPGEEFAADLDEGARAPGARARPDQEGKQTRRREEKKSG